MRPSIRLGRIFGIEIGLHYSWFVVALLIVLSLAGQFHLINTRWPAHIRWLMAGVTGLLFFATILAHELSHAAVAKAHGIPVRSITLFALGGVADIERDSADAATEFWMAIAGPAMSFALGVLFLAGAHLAGWRLGAAIAPAPISASFVWLGYINVAVAIFNMIPAYPLDGGRVLRAIVWGMTQNVIGATKLVAGVGRFMAVALIVFGFFRFVYAGAFGGLWLAFIGWFMADAAAATQARMRQIPVPELPKQRLSA